VERINPEKREEWEAQMMAPLPGESPAVVSDAVVEAEGAAFMAAMGQHAALTGGSDGAAG